MLADFVFILLLIVANGIFAGRRDRRRGAAPLAGARAGRGRPARRALGAGAALRSGALPGHRADRHHGGERHGGGVRRLDGRGAHRAADRRVSACRRAGPTDIALALVVAIVSYLSIVIGELVPKSLALHRPETYALLIARPLLALSWIARPLVRLLTASSNALLVPLGDRTTFTETRHSAEELQHIVEEAAQGRHRSSPGRRDRLARHRLRRSHRRRRHGAARAGGVLPRHASPDEIRRLLLEHGHSRIPVYEGRVDNVVGYLNVKDILAMAWERELIVLDDLVRPAYFVPDSTPAVELLQEMRRRHVLIAMVVDERGGMEGIITMEDLVEELVGEIFSEHVKQVPELFRREAGGTVLVDGAAPVRDVNRALDLSLPEDEAWNSVAGLCLASAGRIPAPGERIAARQRPGAGDRRRDAAAGAPGAGPPAARRRGRRGER